MSKYIAEFAPEALNDIEEAVNFYNTQQQGLGNKFLSEFEKVYKAIQLNPKFASVKYDKIRCAAFRKFPFTVHYKIEEKESKVLIVAVFSTWKEPFW